MKQSGSAEKQHNIFRIPKNNQESYSQIVIVVYNYCGKKQ